MFYFLGNIIAEFPSLIENSRFMFVPGPQDPGPGDILPRPPISQRLTEDLTSKVPFCEFLSNPCRYFFLVRVAII